MNTILIVEDDPLISRMYEQAFSFDKHKAVTATNGEEGLQKATSEKPDAILLDIMMPGLNGLEVLKRLKQDPATKAIPVIMLTNLGEDKDVQAALSLGAVKYIVKVSNTPKQVVDQVEQIVAAATRNKIPEA
jgi:CheY-like chemotaxis protein